MFARRAVVSPLLMALAVFACRDGIKSQALAKVVVRPTDTTLTVGQSAQLHPAALDANDDDLNNYTFTWASSDTTIASVDPTGRITAIATGTAQVTASSSNYSASSSVTVKPVPVAQIKITPDPATVEADQGAVKLSAIALSASGAPLAETFNWTTSDGSIATVNSSGLVTGLVKGTVIISASAGGIAATDTVSVTAPAVASLTVTLAPSNLLEGQTTTAQASLFDGRQHTIPPGPGYVVAWTSSNRQLATVDQSSGVVKAIAPGTTYITATISSVHDSAAVTVLPPVAAVALSPNPDTITLGQTGALSVVLQDANGNPLSGRTVTWSVADTTILGLDPQSGSLTAKATGTTTVTAMSEGQRGSATVAVAVAWANVFSGLTHTCAVTVANVGYCWGFDANGELGIATVAPQTCYQNAPCSSLPVPVAPPAGSATPLQFQEIVPGLYMTCGLTTDAQLYCWGFGFSSGVPTQISLSGVSGTIKVLSVGADDACILTSTQTAYCLGYDNSGALGVPLASAPGNASTLVQVNTGIGFQPIPSNLSVGSEHACASVYLANTYCWGSDQYGQLGLGTSAPASCTVNSVTFDCDFAPIAVPSPNQFNQISAGDTHTCGISAYGGTLCWGRNELGELGNGTTTSSNAPVQVNGAFSWVSAGGELSCAIDGAGTPYCWGGYPAYSSTPTLILAPARFGSISAGGQYVCGLGVDGAAYCSGSNDIGQLGDGNLFFLSTFSRVLAPITPGVTASPLASRVRTRGRPSLAPRSARVVVHQHTRG